MRIFLVEDYEYYCRVTILGFRINFPNIKHIIRTLRRLNDLAVKTRYNTNPLDYGRYFFWSNEEKFTLKERMWYISQMFYEMVGYFPNLKNPRSINEKINWMKLHYDNPKHQRCIDKYEFKDYIKEKLGDGYTIPLLGVWEDIQDVDFDKLPDSFVLKINCTGSGVYGVRVVKDKNTYDLDKLKYEFNNWVQNWMSIYYSSMVKGYKHITSKIIAEEYIEQGNGKLNDYKIFCFHGEPKFVYVALNSCTKAHDKMSGFYDLNWNRMSLAYAGRTSIECDIPRPETFDKMLELAKTLSADFPLVRVDLYEVEGKVYVGELTFFDMGGYLKIHPDGWDKEWGSMIRLPQNNK